MTEELFCFLGGRENTRGGEGRASEANSCQGTVAQSVALTAVHAGIITPIFNNNTHVTRLHKQEP